MTKSTGNCGFGHIYWRILFGKLHFLANEGFRALNNSLVFPEMSLSILKVKNLQGREKATFAIFSVVKFFEHNILQIHKLKWNELNHANNVIFTFIISWLIRKYNTVFQKRWKKHCAGLKEKKNVTGSNS